MRAALAALASCCALLGCGDDSASGAGGNGGSSSQGGQATGGQSTGGQQEGGAGTGGGATGGEAQGGSTGAPTAAEILAALGACEPVSDQLYQSDDEQGAPANIPVCSLGAAFYWQADMDIDCDGRESDVCNPDTDAAFQPQTSAEQSDGQFLDAKTLPYVVIPLPSGRFDYEASGIELGAVVAVIYGDKVVYGVFGDEGPENIIGEASYAMASLLGIDPDPSTGGTDGPVTYVVFPGPGAVVDPIEDHDAATALGEALATALVGN